MRDEPGLFDEVTVSSEAICWIADSRGSLTSRATCSAEAPG